MSASPIHTNRTSIRNGLLIAVGVAITIFLITNHRAHVIGALPYIMLVSFVLLCMFGHGHHGGHGYHRNDSGEQRAGHQGGCHSGQHEQQHQSRRPGETP